MEAGMNKKLTALITLTSIATFLTFASPVFAASADVTKIETFIKSVIQVLVVLAGLIAAGFFVWGGVGYITSSGNPESLDRSKKTIFYSAIGLVIVLGAFLLTNIISDLATGAFGATQ
jgi:TRAP-type C4-dicarboxylate transport system permease small subunit